MTTATRSSGRKRQPSQSGQSRQSSQTRQSGSQTRPSSRSTRSGQSTQTKAAQSGQSTQSSQSSQSARSSRSGGKVDRAHEATVELPFVTAQFHAPEVRVPGREDVTSAANAVRAQLPSRDHALFYGALGLSAAFAVIDWPVALAIGVGTALVSRGSDQQASSSE